jgi:hypothetical protein
VPEPVRAHTHRVGAALSSAAERTFETIQTRLAAQPSYSNTDSVQCWLVQEADRACTLGKASGIAHGRHLALLVAGTLPVPQAGAVIPQRKSYRVALKILSWPKILTANHERPQVGPTFGPTLPILRSRGRCASTSTPSGFGRRRAWRRRAARPFISARPCTSAIDPVSLVCKLIVCQVPKLQLPYHYANLVGCWRGDPTLVSNCGFNVLHE